jgi:hypothetical protein
LPFSLFSFSCHIFITLSLFSFSPLPFSLILIRQILIHISPHYAFID